MHAQGLTGKDPAFVELSDGQRRYLGEYRPAPAAPLEITGEWKVTVEAPAISIPYAVVMRRSVRPGAARALV